MSVEQAYQYLFITVLAVFGVLIGIILIRSVIGPRITDRILCINMISTIVICSIAVLSQMLHEGYLTDIALIYAMFSFLSVMVLATVYIRKHGSEEQAASETMNDSAADSDALAFSDVSEVSRGETSSFQGKADRTVASSGEEAENG